ncbi:synaptogenesis protein syg-2-like [Ruditapes philippinarum]|uniref:synaptogenesis protein syg-2-like n=1 Tax=Ruditapes philippinarum TaxID=129788 RepID=UPI00295C153D|nr:synaptogenesis protein syg-2-like [Ruditapes philippinarum]
MLRSKTQANINVKAETFTQKINHQLSELTMIVKCSPRPSLAMVFPNKIAAAQYTNKTLNFVAYEYLDEENKTKFMWLHKNISIDRNDEKFEIISIGLNSSLSVKNITQMDFGEYSVKVSNTIGEYIHHYMLQAEEKPDVPINLTYKSGSITKSSVTLVWTPGFDGGFPQTFILLYQYNQEEKWHSVQVQDTNEQAMDYTLTGLLSSKVYYITMFAMNKKGNSSYTQNLQITTKINVKTADSQSSDNVGIIGGSISGVAVVMIVSILLAAFFLKRRNIRSSQRESPKQGVIAGSHVSSTYTDLDASRREINNYDDFNVTYEHLNASTRAQNTYMELKNTNVPNADTSDYVNIRI